MIDITGLKKAEVLAALYNASFQQGMGICHKRGAMPMSVEEAEEEIRLNPRMYFDYLHGRVMKVDLKKDFVDTWGYNRGVGVDAAENVIAALRKQ